MPQLYQTLCISLDWLCFSSPLSLGRSWSLQETSPCSSCLFLPPTPKLTSGRHPLPKHRFLWNPPLATFSPDWGKGLDQCVPIATRYKKAHWDTAEINVYISIFPEAWGQPSWEQRIYFAYLCIIMSPSTVTFTKQILSEWIKEWTN